MFWTNLYPYTALLVRAVYAAIITVYGLYLVTSSYDSHDKED